MVDTSIRRVQKYPLNAELKKSFDQLDVNHDGKLSFEECKKLLTNQQISEEKLK